MQEEQLLIEAQRSQDVIYSSETMMSPHKSQPQRSLRPPVRMDMHDPYHFNGDEQGIGTQLKRYGETKPDPLVDRSAWLPE